MKSSPPFNCLFKRHSSGQPWFASVSGKYFSIKPWYMKKYVSTINWVSVWRCSDVLMVSMGDISSLSWNKRQINEKRPGWSLLLKCFKTKWTRTFKPQDLIIALWTHPNEIAVLNNTIYLVKSHLKIVWNKKSYNVKKSFSENRMTWWDRAEKSARVDLKMFTEMRSSQARRYVTS